MVKELLKDRIMLEFKEIKSDSKIIVKEELKKFDTPKVLLVGPDVKSVKIGDKVLLEDYVDEKLKVTDKGVYFVIVREGDIIGIL